MLKAVAKNDIQLVLNFLDGDIISTRIASYLKSYGVDKDFVKFWMCVNGEDVTAVLSLFESSLLIKASEACDKDEVKTFLSMISYSNLSCNEDTLYLIEPVEVILKQGYRFAGNRGNNVCENADESSLKAVYKLICESIPGSFANTKEAYLSFLSDFLFRNRRGLARCKCIRENGKVVACALTSAETETYALISGVASDSAFRKGGYGKRVVSAIVNELLKENKTVYVIALNDSARGFYEHIGFEKYEKIAYIERKTDV